MLLHERINKALRSNADVEIVHFQQDPEVYQFASWNHNSTYIVAPVRGLYTVDALNTFFQGLVPSLEPVFKGSFDDENPYGVLFLGWLRFQECIGTSKTSRQVRILSTSEEKIPIEEPIWENAYIEVYPDAALARSRQGTDPDDSPHIALSEILMHLHSSLPRAPTRRKNFLQRWLG